MKIFKPFTLKWWQGSLFKIAMISIGVALGATWPEFFGRFRTILLLIFLVGAIYLTYIWWKQ